MNSGGLSNWLSVICLMMLGFLIFKQSEQQTEIAALRAQQEARWSVLASRLSLSESNVETKLGEVTNIVNQQTTVIHRALGKVMPIELPEVVSRQLVDLEARIAHEDAWPSTQQESFELIKLLSDLVAQIPPWVEDDLDFVHRLNAVRWGASALALIQKSNTVESKDLIVFLDEVDTAILARPVDASDAITKELEEIRDSEAYKQRQREFQAQADAKIRDEGIRRLRQVVGAGILQAKSEQSPVIRQIYFGKLLDAIITQRQLLTESPDANMDDALKAQASLVNEAMSEENASESDTRDQRLLDYQRDSLAAIKKFNSIQSTFPSMWVDKDDCNKVKNALIEYILPISAGYLDPSVSRLYVSAYDRGWTNLSDSACVGMRTEVAEREIATPRRKL